MQILEYFEEQIFIEKDFTTHPWQVLQYPLSSH